MKLSDIITKEIFNQFWNYLVKYIIKAKNLPAWTIYFLSYIGQFVWKWISKTAFQKKREATQEKAKEILDEKLEDKKSSADDVGKAYEDYINSGRS